MQTETHEALTTARMARKLGVAQQTLWRLTRSSGCPAMRVGRVYRWPVAETVEWLRVRAFASTADTRLGSES